MDIRNNEMVGNINWTFKDYIEQILALSEVIECPGAREQHQALIDEVWQFYPQECIEIGLKDHS